MLTKNMKKIPSIRDAAGNSVVIKQVAAFEFKGCDCEVTLKSGVKIMLKETLDGELEANLRGQFDMFFTS